MKGVRRDVVEIQEPKDENIEKFWCSSSRAARPVRLGTQEEAALGYADRLTTWRKGGTGLYGWVAGAMLLAAGLLALVHWLL